MKIGTDVSLATCWEEGYLIMDFKVRELFPNGRKNALDKDAVVRFYASDGRALGDWCIIKILDTCWDFVSLIEVYERHKEGVDLMCGFDEENPRTGLDDPNEYDMLNLASDLHAYCGLDQ